ncbi:Dpy-30 motif protein (macronuclear) [Tetrahymena thermophila SB210]|uniref:Dpy-30 motif protein n=1 Tax=Tetrahymena thermophila (strain SB210) TaxID=312017 RepID=I7LY74_TETTS|nr:Dpy-30 motif protein [Tetrahymena thermophila SB210]EAS07836.2 Dpy-30 motif protein [Tetrahymena thermophila SB210]|eukprot:XP_001028078.2 Dpy-30 motif protein [Tetrahymena thermophila SB210]
MELNSQYFDTLFNVNRISHGMKCFVRSTDKCKKAFETIGLTPAEFLRPFGRMANKVDFNSINGKKKLVQNFCLNFIDEKEYRIPNKQDMELQMQKVLEKYIPNLNNISVNYKTQKGLDEHIESQRTVWFEKCSECILDYCKFAHPFTFTDQPFYLINFISVDEQDPFKAIQALEQETAPQLKDIFKNNPQEIQNGNIPKANFIVYDSSNPKQFEAAQNILTAFRQRLDQYLNRIIPINSAQAIFDLQPQENYLEARYFIKLATPFNKTKAVLSQDDFNKIQLTINEFVISFLVPNIEAKLKQYHIQYIQQKKTSFWSVIKKIGKGDDARPEVGGAYQMSPYESIVRYIGDVLYLMHDYEQCQEFYKYCQEAFKSKSFRHYASATEMLVYSQVMCHIELRNPINKNDVQQIVNQLTEAITYYTYQLNHTQFAIRGIIFKIYIQFIYDKFDTIVNQHVYDIGYLIKERNDTQKIQQYPLFNCLIQEQYAILLLKQKPSRFRKYCQNLLYAGYQFGKYKFRHHALRCFLIIYKEYESSKWTWLQDFLYKQLAKYFIEISDYKNSYKYVKLLLKNVERRDSLEKHQQTITDTETFLGALEKTSNFPFKDDDQSYIPLPEVSQKSLDIILSDEMLFDRSNQKLSTLQSMSMPGVLSYMLFSEREKSVMHWDEMGLKLLNNSQYKDNMSRQEIERENCILKSFSALCTEDKQSSFDVRGDPKQQFRIAYIDEMIMIKFELSNPLRKNFKIEEFSLYYDFEPETGDDAAVNPPIQELKQPLEIGELKKLQVGIKIIPKCRGILTIKGFKWKVFKIPVIFQFDIKGKLQKDGITRFNNFSNRIKIFPSTGKLILRAINFESKIYFGEVKPLVLELKNEGCFPIKDIRVIFSEPYTYGKSHLNLPNLVIQPGATHVEKIFIRSSSSKECLIKFLIAYRSENNPYFRYARFQQIVQVTQSFMIVQSPFYIYDQYSLHLLIDDQFHHNFIKAKPEEPKLQMQISKGPNIMVQSQNLTNLLDLDLTSSDSTAMDSSLFNKETDENYSLKIHQLILIDNNWRFISQPFFAKSQEKSYYFNIGLGRLSLNRRKTSHYHSQEKNEFIDLLGDEDEGTNQKQLDLLDDDNLTQNTVQQVAKKPQNNEKIQSQQSILSDVDEGDMHFLNFDQNQILNQFSDISNFACDFDTIKNYINSDRQLLYNKYWDKSQDFDHPDFVSITIAWTYKTPEKTYSGLHSLPKVKMNRALIHNKSIKTSPFDSFCLNINLDYQQQVKHNFTLEPVCSVNVQVKIKNQYCKDPVSFNFICINGDESLTSNQNDESYPFFIWEGQTEQIISNLDYQAEEVINLRAIFTSEGFYNINRFKYFFYRNKDTKQLVEPLTQSELSQNKKIEYISFVPLDKEQFFINIVNS